MLAHSITVVQLRGLPPAAPQLIASIASKANRANRNWISTVYFGTKAGTNSKLIIVVQSDGHFEQLLSAIPIVPIGSLHRNLLPYELVRSQNVQRKKITPLRNIPSHRDVYLHVPHRERQVP